MQKHIVANILPPDPYPAPYLRTPSLMQQHGRIYFARRPPPPPTSGWVNRSKFYLFRTWSCCISALRESRLQQQGTKYFACRPPTPPPPHPTLGMGSIGRNSTFSEHGYVAYQIRLQQHSTKILPADPPHDPGDGVNRSKFNVFRTWSWCILKDH